MGIESRGGVKTNYAGLASSAGEGLKDRWGYRVKGVPHNNPATNQPCTGALVISFRSWKAAVKSSAMSINGGVGGSCITCGGGGFINRRKEIVKF